MPKVSMPFLSLISHRTPTRMGPFLLLVVWLISLPFAAQSEEAGKGVKTDKPGVKSDRPVQNQGVDKKGPPIASVDANAVFTRLQTFLASMHTMEAEFMQRVVNPAQGTPAESKGVFYASRPGKFRWDYQYPFVQNIVSDGKDIFFYEPDLKQVSVAQWTSLNNSPASFFVSNEPLESVFTWAVSPDPVFQYPQIRLTPKKPGDVQYIDVLLGPNNDKLMKLSILDSMGNLSHFHFYKGVYNHTIPNERFEFKVPPGVDVVKTESIKH
ncbi:MAG: outer membrane lipoprotein chaperone LolA [Magnetococcales bacterium]|nr:outer membrane lipoprotein chaperone LolA [Magnetococcales bacterium]MBF0420414.1 outer membrane lipoprotein chaperone LolA [Magnetococcales bacterium]